VKLVGRFARYREVGAVNRVEGSSEQGQSHQWKNSGGSWGTRADLGGRRTMGGSQVRDIDLRL
jgi:hypothetical protein